MPDGNATGTALTRAQQFDLELEEQARNFKIMLPAHVPLDKFRRVVVTAVIQDPKLFNADRRSLFMAAQKCASDGLLPDGREAVLLPFNTKVKRKLPDGTQEDAWVDVVQYLPMIQGIRQRMRNTGLVASAEAHVVYRNDKFFQKFGSDPQIVHEPPALGTGRGEPVGAYAIIRLTSGEVIQEVLDHAEIERVRSFSKAKDGPAWRNHWGEMARKTVLKRAAKSAPTSADMLQLLERDEEEPDRGMVDVSHAAYEPEPPRQIANGKTPDGPAYLVIDADGEEHEFETADATAAAILIVFRDAAKRGASALDAAAENNRETVAALARDGFDVGELRGEWGGLHANLDPFGLPPSNTDDRPGEDHAPTRQGEPPAGNHQPQPGGDRDAGPMPAGEPHDLLGDAPAGNVTVPLPPRDATPADFAYYARQLLAAIAEKPGDVARLARVKMKNEPGIQRLKAEAVALYDEVQRALQDARK